MTGRRSTSQFMPVRRPLDGNAKVEMRINECGELMELKSSGPVSTGPGGTGQGKRASPSPDSDGCKRSGEERGTRVMRSLAAEICEI